MDAKLRPIPKTPEPPAGRAELAEDADFYMADRQATHARVFRGRRCFVVTSSVYEIASTMHRGATIAGVVSAEVADMEEGVRSALAAGWSAAEVAEDTEDRAVWEGDTIVAVLRVNPAAEIIVTVLAEDA